MKVLVFLFLGIWCIPSQANLLINGSFENPDIAYGHYQYIDASDVPGWEGDAIEIWDHLYAQERMEPFDGEQYIEMNSVDGGDGVYEIFQTFTSKVGSWYQVSMAAQARRSNNEVFSFSVVGDTGTIFERVVSEHTTSGWSTVFYQFQATSDTSTLYLTSSADVAPNLVTAANLVDNIEVLSMSQNNIANVDVPVAPALLGLSMVALGLYRQKRK